LAEGHAPGKVILFGEHAVVHGRPAIAVPVMQVQARAEVHDNPGWPGVTIHAQDIGQVIDVANAPQNEPLSATVRHTLAHMGFELGDVQLRMTLRSSIPVASGLGSGAAVATALVRALCAHLGQVMDAAAISAVVYETEKLLHGTPSGIDNTTVAFEQPVYFCRGQPIRTLQVARPFWLAIADTGVPSPTKAAVADVRAALRREPERYGRLFDEIGILADLGRRAIEEGRTEALGPLMDKNQDLLRQLDVSSPELEALIAAARQVGALGAKLCGGGRGGNMIALVQAADAGKVKSACLAAGAKTVFVTKVG
jgi:mevalonate kinase